MATVVLYWTWWIYHGIFKVTELDMEAATGTTLHANAFSHLGQNLNVAARASGVDAVDP